MDKLLLVLLFALAGCDRVVSQEYTGPRELQHKTISCTHTSYCYTCGMGFDGKMNCAFKLSPSCPGTQQGVVAVSQVRTTYESGKVIDWQDEEVIDREGVCR